MRRLRVFAGIDLDERTRAACAAVASRLEARGLRARYEPAAKLHVTLAFLGFIDAESIAPIAETLHRVAAETKPFSITLDKVGAFPHERNPHVVYVGARSAGKAFRDLARKLRGALGELGLRFGKDAVAHVTIARVKKEREHLPLVEFEPIRFTVRELTLFESVPEGGSTVYRAIGLVPLLGFNAPRR